MVVDEIGVVYEEISSTLTQEPDELQRYNRACIGSSASLL